MRRKFHLGFALFLALCAIPHYVAAQQASSNDCPNKVVITSPSEGEDEGYQVFVKGTADIQDQRSKVWVLIHNRDKESKKWCPWEPNIDGKGNWWTWVEIGDEHSVGMTFEIAAATFDETEEKQMLAYEWSKKADRNPIPFPRPSSNVDTVMIRKKSHQ